MIQAFICLSLASLLALAGSAPVTQAQPDDPVDEENEDYVTLGVEPACPFTASSTAVRTLELPTVALPIVPHRGR